MFIVKVPGINGLGKTKGCEQAGNLVLSSLKKNSINEGGELIDFNKIDLEEIHLDNTDLKFSNKLIYENALEIFETQPKVIFLGGDHSISYSLAKAFLHNSLNHKKQSCLIIFDAHPDCIFSDGSIFPTNQGWLRRLVESGFPSENILLVGIRNLDSIEAKFLKEQKIKYLSMNQFTEDIQNACDTLMEFSNKKELYVSIDIDVIDPCFAPGTSFPETGGLSSREFLFLIHRINKMKNLRAIDLVEINSLKDKDNLTINLGAKIVGELL